MTTTIPVRMALEKTQRGATLADDRIVPGWLITSGLAMHHAYDREGVPNPDRFSITHLDSGLSLMEGRCDGHAKVAAQLAVDSGIDWTGDGQAVVADRRLWPLRDAIVAVCGLLCDGCGGQVAS